MAGDTIKDYEAQIVHLSIENKDELENFRLKWLSKKGLLAQLFSAMKEIQADERREYGQKVNELKSLAEEKFNNAKEKIDSKKSNDENVKMDLTVEAAPIELGGLHPLSIIRNQMVDIFSRIGFALAEGPEIVDDWHNFTALNIPPDHPARDMQDTFFVSRSPDYVLRTHTSSVQVKLMQNQPLPIRAIMPGRVFRKDNDATHSPVFHQIEGLYIDENVSFADLKQTLFFFVQEIFGPDSKVRFRPSYFPFTEPSAEMDIAGKKINPETGKEEERWLEILGCGMVDPSVLINCGIDPERYSGYAFGMGIERIAMLKFGIQDIRLFYENDLRFLEQFKSLK